MHACSLVIQATVKVPAKRFRDEGQTRATEGESKDVVKGHGGSGGSGGSGSGEVTGDENTLVPRAANEADTANTEASEQDTKKYKQYWKQFAAPKPCPKNAMENKADHNEATGNNSTAMKAHASVDHKDAPANTTSAANNDETEAAAAATAPEDKSVATLPTPAAVKNEPSISPAEQAKQMDNDPAPKRGRPKKRSASTAATKPKAKPRASRAKSSEAKSSKPKAKAKGKASRKAKEEACDEECEETPLEEDDADEGNEEQDDPEHSDDQSLPGTDPTAASSYEKPKTKTAASKADSKNAAPKRKSSKKKIEAEKVASTKEAPTKKAPKVAKAKAKAKQSKKGLEKGSKRAPQERTAEQKALLSRKSCAYKKARKAARDAGLSEEEVNAAAKKAGSHTMYICTLSTHLCLVLCICMHGMK